MLFLDYLKKVRKDSPIFFFIVVQYSLLQLLFTFIKLEITPIVLYGMFSQKIPMKNEFYSLEIKVNDVSIEKYKINFWQKDILYTTYENYINICDNNNIDIVKTRVETRYPLLINSFLYPMIEDKIYNTPKNIEAFKPWFKQKIAAITGAKVVKVAVYKELRTFDRNTVSITHQQEILIEKF